ncbi:hypothetical protein B0J14DRAFT_578303 [Halenospora varia]|nr:hypothetical protein B0J14DRAFT_578303 [Halenospora varia]
MEDPTSFDSLQPNANLLPDPINACEPSRTEESQSDSFTLIPSIHISALDSGNPWERTLPAGHQLYEPTLLQSTTFNDDKVFLPSAVFSDANQWQLDSQLLVEPESALQLSPWVTDWSTNNAVSMSPTGLWGTGISTSEAQSVHVLKPHAYTHNYINEEDNPIVIDEENTTGKESGSEVQDFSKSLASLMHRRVYLRASCATCDGPLSSLQYLLDGGDPDLCCIRSKTHLSLICNDAKCGLKFRNLGELVQHADTSHHEALHCGICHVPLHSYKVGAHFRTTHIHIKWRCAECNEPFESRNLLDQHGTDSLHAAYKCQFPDCNSETTNHRDLHRHQLSHTSNVPRHSCPHCRKYRGENGFKRKDHLRQHIRNYHHIDDFSPDRRLLQCKEDSCDWPLNRSDILETLTEHMLLKHQSSAFVCKHEGCDRVGMNGFDQNKLLSEHQKKEHPSPFQCAHPGCERIGNNGWKRQRDMVKHMQKFHGPTA